MTDEIKQKENQPKTPLSQKIEKVAIRKLRARRQVGKTVWFGLGMMGLIGWSVAIPTLIGALTGLWLDKHYPGNRSLTLVLLVAGLCIGCFNAWYWVAKEDKAMREEHEEDDD